MALKSVLDIELNDEAFQRYQKQFAQHQEALKQTPEAWKSVGKAVNDVSSMISGMSRSGNAGVDMMQRMSAAGKATTTTAAATAQAFEKQAAALTTVRTISTDIARDQSRASTSTDKQLVAWHALVTTSRTVRDNIAGMAKDLLKLSTVGVAGGLLGAAGGLFGFDRLAASAAGFRRSALGLGTSIGEQRAFNLDFARVVDPNAFLGGVNTALHDVTKSFTFGALGVQTQGRDTAQVGVDVLGKVKALADRTPSAQLAQIMSAYGIGNLGLSLQDVERLKATPQSELGGYVGQYQKDRAALGLSEKSAKQFQDFQNQLGRAGKQIETVFMTGLVPLTGPLMRLSAGFERAVAAFLGSATVRKWMTELGTGLNWLAVNIDKPSFQRSVTDFATEVGKIVRDFAFLGKAIVDTIDFFRNATGKSKIGAEVGGAIGAGAGLALGGPVGAVAGGVAGAWLGSNVGGLVTGGPKDSPARLAFEKQANTPGTAQYRETHTGGAGWGYNRDFGYFWSPGAKNERNPFTGEPVAGSSRRQPVPPLPLPPSVWRESFYQNDSTFGLPRGLTGAVYEQESGGGKYLLSPAGAQGPFQIMPATAKQYGLANPYDTASSAQTMGQIIRDNMAHFHGDLPKALAAYNAGAGEVDREVRRYGPDWEAHLPDETKNYLARILGMLQAQQNARPSVVVAGAQPAPLLQPKQQQRSSDTHVYIHNQTGGSAVVSAGQLPG